MLHACGVSSSITLEMLGGAPFLCFESPPLTASQQAFLSHLSALYMTALLENGCLRPMESPMPPFLPNDMPEILKYKGKTNADFTQLLINLALSAGGQWRTEQAHVLDPICGHGTTLFCALSRGMDATGIDSDRKSIAEGVTYAQKWLQYHRIKHTAVRSSLTLPAGKSAPCTTVTVQNPAAVNRSLRMILADTRDTSPLCARRKAHAIVADLPYGVQHAPYERGRLSTLDGLLEECLPAWRQALQPGCAAAIAFNTYTLKRKTLEKLVLLAGFILPDSDLYADFSHWVEQAVQRDILLAVNPIIQGTTIGGTNLV